MWGLMRRRCWIIRPDLVTHELTYLYIAANLSDGTLLGNFDRSVVAVSLDHTVAPQNLFAFNIGAVRDDASSM